jgi:hypothetical protein
MSDRTTPPTEQNLAAMVLTVTAVTLAFLSVFVLTLDGVVLEILVGAVLSIGAITFVVIVVLDMLGYFDDGSEPVDETGGADVDAKPEPRRPESPRRANRPLSPLINFDSELAAIRAHFDGSPPDAVRRFEKQYRQLKQADRERRKTIASDLRTSVNPIEVLVGSDERMAGLVEGMGERLFRYIKSDAGDLLTLAEVEFLVDGERREVGEIAGREARLETSVHNDGEETDAEVSLQFLGPSGIQVRREFLPVGTVRPNQTKTLDTRVYVPTNAKSVSAVAVEAAPGEPVLEL